jgi:ATP-dependent Clp protease ATP-binding subunit ClpA
MFERFTGQAIKVIMLAQEEARRLGHNFVGTEQILLGLIGEGTGIAAKTLKSMGVNLKDARVEVEKIISRGSGFVAVEIPFTPRAKRGLELSWDEARNLGHNYIGTEHLLLGLVREGDGVACRVLENLGVKVERIRPHVVRLFGEVGSGQQSARPEHKAPSNPEFVCPNCAERVPSNAIACRHCGYGISDEHFTECPFCQERIRKGATKCRFCMSSLDATWHNPQEAQADPLTEATAEEEKKDIL